MRGEDKEDKVAAWSTSRLDRSLLPPSPPASCLRSRTRPVSR